MDALRRGSARACGAAVALFAISAAGQSLPPAPAATQPAATAATTAPAEPLLQWSSAQFRVRVAYPKSWQLVDKPPASDAFAARIPLKENQFAAINLRIDRALPPGSAQITPAADQAAMTEVSGAMAAYVFNNGGKKVTLKPDKLGSAASTGGPIPARRVRFLRDKTSGQLATIDVIGVRNGIAYVWTVEAPAGEMDSLLPEVQQTLDSFETLQ